MIELAAPRKLIDDAQSRRETPLLALCVVVALAYIPTIIALNAGPWQTEQEGHGPFLIAAAAYFAWRKGERLRGMPFRPAPVFGWIGLLGGLLLLYVGRSQNILTLEMLGLLPILAGVVLMIGGWSILRILAFPIFLLFFAVPPPGWLLDAATLPLKILISDVVSRKMYALGYPVAQNGVVIMVGPYQLLVKDACAGMNSIFALSAIGAIYVYMMQYRSWWRNAAIILAILPITIAANMVRVFALVLIAYYFGSSAVEGVVHDATGFALFVVAFVILISFDGLLAVLAAMAIFGRRLSSPGGEGKTDEGRTRGDAVTPSKLPAE